MFLWFKLRLVFCGVFMESLKACVIGVGSMGQNHARIYSDLENIELAGIADLNRPVGEKLSKKFKCNYYPNFNEMVSAEKPDLISLVTPTSTHEKIALKLLENGIPLLIEKPIASTVFEGKKIIDAAEKSKAKLMIGHIERFNPAIVELKKRLALKELGQVYKIDVQRIGPFPSRINDVGVAIDLAVHDLDIINFLFSPKIERIFAETDKKIHPSHEDTLTAMVKFGKILALINVNWLTPTKIRTFSVTGEKGMFEVNYLTQDLCFFENPAQLEYDFGNVSMVVEGNMTKIKVDKKEPLKAELQAFCDFAKSGTISPVSGKDALIALNLAEKILESAKTHKAVKA